MSGITVVTALEINNHPEDLYIQIGQETEAGMYAFSLSRGRGHNYKLLISTSPFAETIEQVVEEVKKLLSGIHLWATKELENKESLASQICNPGGMPVDISKTLNPDLIQRILSELQKNQVADTYKMFA